MDYWLQYANQILIFSVFALSLNLLLGYAGQVSVAHGAFGALGGYAVAYLIQAEGWNIIPALLVGIVAAVVVGLAVALSAMRLSVEFLILLTLALSYVVIGVFTTFGQLGGTYGLVSLPAAEIFGWSLNTPIRWLPILAVVAAVVYSVCWRIGESPYGRVLKGIREDPQVVQSLGKSPFRFKLAVFGVTSAMAGLAGGLFSANLQLATPSTFSLALSLQIFAMVILGGVANLKGSFVGVTLVVLLDPLLDRVLQLSPTSVSIARLIIYGAVLIVCMLLRPQGLLPEGRGTGRTQPPVEAAGTAAELTPAPEVRARLIERVPGSPVGDLLDRPVTSSVWAEAKPTVVVSGLSKHFGGIVAASDLSFELRAGAVVALVGPNGAGKTTVFNLLTGFIRPDSGSIKLDGAEIVGLPSDSIARRGMVRSFQDVRLFSRLSCLDNVALGLQGQPGETLRGLFAAPKRTRAEANRDRERARELLDFVGLSDHVDEPAGELSYGQSKLVSLARMMATDAQVYLLDEPASGVDSLWVDALLETVVALRDQGRTVCLVEHNLSVVERLADHAYFMELGRVTAEGTMAELMSSPRLADAYFGSEAGHGA